MSAKEAQRGINIFLLRPSAALMQKVGKWKQTEQVGANLRSLSFTLLLGSPASGDQSGWRTRPKTKQNKAKKRIPSGQKGRSSEGISLGSDCKRERRRHCCQSVQKYSPVYCWNMKPFFLFLSFFLHLHFQFAAGIHLFFKFRNIASSLFLPIHHPPLTFLFFSFLIYIYIFFLAAFFFFLFYYFTKMRDRMMDG